MKSSLLISAALAFLLLPGIAVQTIAADDASPNASLTKNGPPRIDVILWFDTEDYLLPADDDACKRLAGILTQRGIHGTFKVVGEKARTLERRGRQDVIDALKKHTIGYHANFHSVHPTPSEYLADCGFLDGINEFVRREGGGAADVRRIFGVPTLACYGQPGSSWSPQGIAALRQIGVAPAGQPCYIDEGSHVGLDEKPFWYEGAINVYHMGHNVTRMELHDPAAVEPAKAKVSEIAEHLRQEGGGLISIFYHPCEWVHEQFWDGVNFAHGRNPPREEWKAPPQLPAEETEGAFHRFEQYLDHIRSVPGVRFITAADLPAIYADVMHKDGVSREEMDELAKRILNTGPSGQVAMDYQVIGRKSFSVADQFELFTLATGQIVSGKAPVFPLFPGGLLGPDSAAPASRTDTHLNWPAFRDATLDVRDFITKERSVPARVFIGAEPVPPGDFLVALASAYQEYQNAGKAPDGVSLGMATGIAAERYIAKDTPQLFGGWVIHPQGFRAPKIMEIARLQAWTLKPALRAE